MAATIRSSKQKSPTGPTGPVARPRRAAISEEGFEKGLDALGRKPDSETPTIGGDKPAKRPKMTDAEQSAEFEKVARELECDPDDEKFTEVLRKLAKPKA